MNRLTSVVPVRARRAITGGGLVLIAAAAAAPAPAVAAEEEGGCFWTCMATFGPVVKHSDHWHMYDGCMNVDGMIVCFY